jgi:aryl-alcohol dehydrogenase-like predicted oxidoreductase
MLTRSLGKNGPTSSAIGLGCMGMSDFYGPSDRAESIAAIRAALQHHGNDGGRPDLSWTSQNRRALPV